MHVLYFVLFLYLHVSTISFKLHIKYAVNYFAYVLYEFAACHFCLSCLSVRSFKKSKSMYCKRYFKKLVSDELNKLMKTTKTSSNASASLIDINTTEYERACEIQNELKEKIENGDGEKSFVDEITDWAITFNITRKALDMLLKILSSKNFDVPCSAETIITRQKSSIREVAAGTYVHLGVEKQLKKIEKLLQHMQTIELDIGIDGLPLYKSSSLTLWPILAKVVPEINARVMIVGVYLGKQKPMSVNCYLHDFVEEMKNLISYGIIINNKNISIKLRAFICDAPAKAFMCNTVGHNALHGCSRCLQIGERKNHTTVFSTTMALPRTDEEFFQRKHQEYHKSPQERLILEEIGIQMVTQFPLDPMHLIDLGVTKKILQCLIKGHTNYKKLNYQELENISQKLISIVPYIPKEFARKPRSLSELCRWKAVEFRQFILYTGIFALRDVVNIDLYEHFLLLHCAYRLLSCEENYTNNIDVAGKMLEYFVMLFPNIYNAEKLSYNVHSLLHLIECVKQMGFINSFSAYKFENKMQKLKKYVKQPTKILEQIENKNHCCQLIKEEQKIGTKINRFGKIISYTNKSFTLTLKSPNNFCCVDGIAIEVTKFYKEDNEIYVVGKKLINHEAFFEKPMNSFNSLNIFLADKSTNELEEKFKINNTLFKLFYLPYNNKYLFIPFSHRFASRRTTSVYFVLLSVKLCV